VGKVKIGGVAGLVAPLLGKQPPDTHVWVLTGNAPPSSKWRVRSTMAARHGGLNWPLRPDSNRSPMRHPKMQASAEGYSLWGRQPCPERRVAAGQFSFEKLIPVKSGKSLVRTSRIVSGGLKFHRCGNLPKRTPGISRPSQDELLRTRGSFSKDKRSKMKSVVSPDRPAFCAAIRPRFANAAP